MKHILTTILLAVLLVACGSAAPKATPQTVIDAFRAAGLEAESARPMTKDDYGMAPMLASDGLRFIIPSLGADKGGRVFLFDNQEDLQTMKLYYDEFGKKSAALFSWTFAQGNLLVQINGDLPEEQAKKYEAALKSVIK